MFTSPNSCSNINQETAGVIYLGNGTLCVKLKIEH